MDEKNRSSSWDELIKEIGAQPPADAAERRRPAIQTQFEPAPVEPIVKAKPGDWAALANELGVEPSADSDAVSARGATTEGRSSSLSPVDIEATFAGIAPIESEFEEIVEEEIADVEFERDDAEFEDDSDFEDEDDDDSDLSDEVDVDLTDAEEPDALRPTSLSGEAARNAFEALFQAGAFSMPSRGDQPTPQRRESPPDRLFADAERRPRPPHRERTTDSSRDDTDPTHEDPSHEDERRRPRRRRRRGRGRRGSAESDRPARESTAENESDVEVAPSVEWQGVDQELQSREADDAEEPTAEGRHGDRRRRPRRRRSRVRGDAAEGAEPARAAPRNGRTAASRTEEQEHVDADDDHDESLGELAGPQDDSDEDVEDGGSSRAVHKGIPSWAEAIGVMVETNMQSRKNAPQRPSRERGRGRGGRGGGRGRRRQ